MINIIKANEGLPKKQSNYHKFFDLYLKVAISKSWDLVARQ